MDSTTISRKLISGIRSVPTLFCFQAFKPSSRYHGGDKAGKGSQAVFHLVGYRYAAVSGGVSVSIMRIRADLVYRFVSGRRSSESGEVFSGIRSIGVEDGNWMQILC